MSRSWPAVSGQPRSSQPGHVSTLVTISRPSCPAACARRDGRARRPGTGSTCPGHRRQHRGRCSFGGSPGRAGPACQGRRAPCRDHPAGHSRFPGCKLVQAAERPADVLVGNQPVLSLGRRAVVVCPDAHRRGRRPVSTANRSPAAAGTRASAASSTCCISGRGHRPGFWCQAATVRTAIPGARRTPRCSSAARPATRTRHARSSRSRRPWPADPVKAEMTVPDSRPGRAPGMSGRAQAHSAIPRTSAGLTVIWRAARSLGRSPRRITVCLVHRTMK